MTDWHTWSHTIFVCWRFEDRSTVRLDDMFFCAWKWSLKKKMEEVVFACSDVIITWCIKVLWIFSIARMDDCVQHFAKATGKCTTNCTYTSNYNNDPPIPSQLHSCQPLLGVNLSPEFVNLYFPNADWSLFFSFFFLLVAAAFWIPTGMCGSGRKKQCCAKYACTTSNLTSNKIS